MDIFESGFFYMTFMTEYLSVCRIVRSAVSFRLLVIDFRTIGCNPQPSLVRPLLSLNNLPAILTMLSTSASLLIASSNFALRLPTETRTIMHQHALFANEISLEIGDCEVVSRLRSPGFRDGGDAHAAAVFGDDGHARRQLFGPFPTLSGDPPLMHPPAPRRCGIGFSADFSNPKYAIVFLPFGSQC